MKRLRLVTLALAVTVGALGIGTENEAYATQKTATLAVSATVVASCTISTTPIAFTGYDPLLVNKTANLDSTGTVVVNCSNGAVTTIGLDQGQNPATGSTGVAPHRRMISGTNFVSYDFYQDSMRTTVWGDIGTTAALSYTSTGILGNTLNVYGRMPLGQDAAVGSYTDSVTATINF